MSLRRLGMRNVVRPKGGDEIGIVLGIQGDADPRRCWVGYGGREPGLVLDDEALLVFVAEDIFSLLRIDVVTPLKPSEAA